MFYLANVNISNVSFKKVEVTDLQYYVTFFWIAKWLLSIYVKIHILFYIIPLCFIMGHWILCWTVIMYLLPDPTFQNLFYFIWLRWVLVAALRVFSCSLWTLSYSMWDLVPWPGSKSRPPVLGTRSLSHWISREVPRLYFLFYFGKLWEALRNCFVHYLFTCHHW